MRDLASCRSQRYLSYSLVSTCDSVKRSLILSFGIADTMAVEAGFCEAAYSEQTLELFDTFHISIALLEQTRGVHLIFTW